MGVALPVFKAGISGELTLLLNLLCRIEKRDSIQDQHAGGLTHNGEQIYGIRRD